MNPTIKKFFLIKYGLIFLFILFGGFLLFDGYVFYRLLYPPLSPVKEQPPVTLSLTDYEKVKNILKSREKKFNEIRNKNFNYIGDPFR